MKATTKLKAHTNESLAEDPALKRLIQDIRGALAKAAKSDIPSRYRIGQRIEEIRSSPGKKYGRKVVATLAGKVGMTASYLYQHADVARMWDEAKFDDVGRRAASAGLMFSHFVELAHDDHADHRDRLLEEAILDRLSVRALRARRVREEKTARRHGAKPAQAHGNESPKVDVLERVDREGMTDDVLEEVNTELRELRELETQLRQRIGMLEEARERWGESPPSDESGMNLGKAAE